MPIDVMVLSDQTSEILKKHILKIFSNNIYFSLRHAIAGDVVMLSHLAMKLYYVRMDTEQLDAEVE